MKKSSSSAPANSGVLTLAACCILLATCSQARRISHRHDVAAPHEALDTGGWRPVVESGRPSLDQVAVAPTGYDGDTDLVPPPRRIAAKGAKKRVAQAAASSYSTPSFAASPVRFPGEQEAKSKRRPIRRNRPGAGHLRPYIAQESAQQQVRFKPSPPAPENLWVEPTEPTVGFFTPQQYNEGPLQLAIASQSHQEHQQQHQQQQVHHQQHHQQQVHQQQKLHHQPEQQQQVVSTQQVFGNPAFFDLGSSSIRRPQDNTFIEPSVYENEVIQGVHHLAVNAPPQYQIDTPSSPPPVRRRKQKPRPATQATPIDPDMHRGTEIHEVPVWTTEAPVIHRRPQPEVHVEEEEQEPVRPRRPFRPPAPVQEQLDDDMEVPVFKMRPRKPIVTLTAEENTHQEERPRIRRPHPATAPVVQEDLEEEVSPARPLQEEERPLKRRRPRPPVEGKRRRRPKPRPQPVIVVEEEEQQQPQPEIEEDRNVHRRPIPSWPTKPAVTEESVQEQQPEVEQENYPSVFPLQHQQQKEEIIPEDSPSEETVEETFPSSVEAFESQPVPEEPNPQEPNQVSSTEGLFSIPPKRKRPEVFESTAAPAPVVTTTTAAPLTTTASISSRLRAKLNGSRPRFSLNNIKERLRQQQEQSENKEEQVTTEATRPGRFQVGTLPTTTSEAPVERQTFRPSMNRYTRPPLSSRYRNPTATTTEAPDVLTTTPAAARRAIPSLYNKERRPLLRTRTTTEAPLTTTEEIVVPHEEDEDKDMESTTQEMEEMTTIMPVSSTTPEYLSYASRVTDLTSSATAFKPLSFFSAVPANGVHPSQLRFTMATEDPILPIEAFFPAFASKPAPPHGE
ncbi:titin-like [Cloeon dipterum]|uniref:titin-like n=1 Tax=Cloeon dipterum TaxID=197152 RepID=UPI00321FF91B